MPSTRRSASRNAGCATSRSSAKAAPRSRGTIPRTSRSVRWWSYTPDADHGFLLTKEGGLLYFHRNAVLIGDFDRLDRGDEVYYVEDLGDTGPIATKVRVKAEG